MRLFILSRLPIAWSLALMSSLPCHAVDTQAALKIEPAVASAFAETASVLGVAHAGDRIVTVGDHGIVLLSDDRGKTYRQAMHVPVSSTLTAVSFSDAGNGWAAGSWGIILHTKDGGEHWEIQRSDLKVDRPLFSIHFWNAQDGLAVGLWSLMLITHDAGKTWTPIALQAPTQGGKADLNLFSIAAASTGHLFVAAEHGYVLRSDDLGRSWTYQATGYTGSFWNVTATTKGEVLVAGLRGNAYRSRDDGETWDKLNTGTQSSITQMVQIGSTIVGVGLDGVETSSLDNGATFTVVQRQDHLSFTAALVDGGHLLRYTVHGPIPPKSTRDLSNPLASAPRE